MVIDGVTLEEWAKAPGIDVQFVTIFYKETYDIWVRDGYDESGKPINQRLETENYCEQFYAADYYWYGGAGTIVEIPTGAVVKRGKFMPDAEWKELFAKAYEDRRVG